MRLGVSLVELIVTLTACSAVLTISVALLHRAMHAQSRARSYFDGERSAWRLTQQFRRDAHDALAVETEDGASETSGGSSAEGELVVRFEMHDGESVEYRQSGGRVERTRKIAAQIGARDVFTFSEKTRFSAVVETPRVVALSIEPATELSSENATPPAPFATSTILRVEAALGRNARFAPSKDDAHNDAQDNAEPAL
jgi:type II secretory pathway component PulJ